MGAETKRWSMLVQRCWGASPSLEGWERLKHLRVPPRRCGSLAMSRSTETFRKITSVFQLVSKPRCGMRDARLGVFSWGSKPAVLGPGGGIMAVPCEMCFGAGSRQQNLAEIKEILEIPRFNILSFVFGLAWCFAWRF